MIVMKRFTLPELMIVIAIIGLLAAIWIGAYKNSPAYKNAHPDGKEIVRFDANDWEVVKTTKEFRVLKRQGYRDVIYVTVPTDKLELEKMENQ